MTQEYKGPRNPKQILMLDSKGCPALYDLVDNKPLPQDIIDWWAETGVDVAPKDESE